MPENNNTQTPTDTTLPPVQVEDASVEAVSESPANPAASAAPVVPEATVPESAPAPDPVVDPVIPDEPASESTDSVPSVDVTVDVAHKIGEAHNVLIALSSDPSVDEMAAAIGLSLYLDKFGKRATAIYSGSTPNALEFLKPEETFEPSADTLQDFVIALNKDKADHLRYKLDGDFVKIYITPYKTRIDEDDLDFSYGDYNVDLVLALDVANGVDLDAALREHGRIMHDASIINITTGNPGKLGEIEWSDKNASSVSEMIAKLLYSINSKVEIGKEEATAFLTGIVAATNRFSSASTTSETMELASKLMDSGANQQLVSKNITPDIENEMITLTSGEEPKIIVDDDPTKLDIEHGNETGVDEKKEVDTTVTEKESTLLDDLKAAEASLSQAGAEITPEENAGPLAIESEKAEPVSEPAPESTVEPNVPEESSPEVISEPTPESVSEEPQPEPIEEPKATEEQQEKVVQPSESINREFNDDSGATKYGKMLEDALEGIGAEPPLAPASNDNPAAANTPVTPAAPEINGVPEMNYMPMPGEEILPPPPTPPIDMNAIPQGGEAMMAPTQAPVVSPIEAAAPVASEPTPAPLGAQPAMQDQIYGPQSADPGAFKIPGM